MEFKIDTTAHYTTILPEAGALDASLAGSLRARCQELRDEAPRNLILNFAALDTVEDAAYEALAGIHEDSYGQDCSVVFTAIPETALREMKKQDLHHALNITPTLQEAIDMVMMENMERDLFKEEF